METRRRRDRRPHLPAVHVRARHRPDRLHVQPVPHRRRRAAALPHRAARRCSRRCRRGDRDGRAGRAAALDHVRSPRGRRVRRDEPVPRGGARRAGRARRARLHGVDQRPRRPAARADGGRTRCYDLGGRRVRNIDTPHVPHGWDAHVLYEETTGTLFCGDLFTQVGDGPALTTDDVVDAAAQAEDMFGATCLTPHTAPTIRRLAELEPTTLAIMHGSSYNGEAAQGAARAGRRLRPPPDQRRLTPTEVGGRRSGRRAGEDAGARQRTGRLSFTSGSRPSARSRATSASMRLWSGRSHGAP